MGLVLLAYVELLRKPVKLSKPVSLRSFVLLKLVAETRRVASYTETHLFRRSDTYHRDARQKVHGRYPKALTFEGAQYLTA